MVDMYRVTKVIPDKKNKQEAVGWGMMNTFKLAKKIELIIEVI